MSQLYIPVAGSSPSGPFLESLTGNTGGAVFGDAANNINVVGDGNFITVSGNPGTNTLTISPVDSTYITATTVDATPLTVFSLPVNASEALRLTALYIANYSTSADALCGSQAVLALRTGAAAPVAYDNGGDILKTVNVTDAAGVQFGISGNSLIVQVVGVAATTINWKVYISVITYP